MAITQTHLTDGASTTDGTSWSTAAISPAPDALILLTILPAAASGAVAAISSVTGCGLTWVPVVATSGGQRTNNLFRAMGSAPTTGVLTVTMAASSGAIIWSVDQFTGVDTTGADGSGAIVQSVQDKPTATTSASLAFPATPTPGNAVFAAIGVAAATAGMASGSGWTMGVASTITAPSSALFTEYGVTDPLPDTITGSWTTSAVPYIVGVEILAGASTQTFTSTLSMAAAGGMSVAGSLSKSALLAMGASDGLAVGTLRQQAAVLPVAGVSGAAIGALRTQLGTLAVAGAGSFVSNTGASAALAVRGTPALSIGVLLIVDYHPGKRVSAHILDGPGLALLTPSDVQVPVQGSDNFDTLDPARWFSMGPASQVYASGGQLVCRVNTDWNGYVQSIPAFDLNESIAAIEMVQITQNDGDADNWFSFGNNKSYNDNNFNIDFEFGRIDCSYTLGGAFVTIAQVPYNPVVHRWVRYRIQDGVAYWEFSTDGLQWITMASWVVQFDLSAMYALIGGGFSYGAPPRDAIYDNFLVTRAAVGGSVADAVLLNHGGNAVIARG